MLDASYTSAYGRFMGHLKPSKDLAMLFSHRNPTSHRMRYLGRPLGTG